MELELTVAILGVLLVTVFAFFGFQIYNIKEFIEDLNSRQRMNFDMLLNYIETVDSGKSLTLKKHAKEIVEIQKYIKESTTEPIEISSRLKYVTDEKALKIWDFLKKYQYKHKDKYKDEHIVIPSFRVLDALSMINQDKIEYYEG